MKLITDNATLQKYLPNQIATVKGETALFDKITAHLEAAENWVIDTFCSVKTFNTICGYVESNPIKQIVSQLVCTEAMRLAIPSLDLVFTPNGFGVVSTNTVGAASKQRVDRLIGSLRDIRDNEIEQVLLLLPEAHAWATSSHADFFGATLFPNIDLVTFCGITSARWDKYLELRSRCISIELTLAEDYFSPELMSELRHEFLVGSMNVQRLRLVHAIRSQVVDVLQDKPINGTRMRDLVNYIRHNPELFPTWHNSATAQLFSPPKFENKKKSSGYFF